jgi:Tol biopolymer transport system component
MLQPGSRFGVFEIQSLVGSGGMGDVFRATDTRLGRPVALKVLRTSVAGGPEHLDRFTREARALAALNHPGIGAIYDTVETDGVRALVLEFVEGETLEQRLRSGPLPIREAITIARAIAESLDAAHERGLVHRDLKPANVKITPAGDVKLLDFGIARMVVGFDGHDAGTVTGTERGVVIGTAAYMSPEQARGHPVDKRADVWAFGCVLYEMLAGRAAFRGETWSDSVALTLTGEPDWKALPPHTPAGVMRVLERCLDKDPKQRLRGLGGVELALEAHTTPAAAGTGTRFSVIGLAAAMVAATVVAVIAAIVLRPDTRVADAAPMRFEIPPSIRTAESGSFALSPNGRHLAFIGTGGDGRFQLWERSLGSLETRPINGTEGEVAGNTTIFWSPDSRTIGFYADGVIKRIDHAGGQVQVVCKMSSVGIGGAWNGHGDIVVGDAGGGLVQCPASGGRATPVTIAADAPDGAMPRTLHMFPAFLPGGRRMLYLRVSRGSPPESGLYVADLDLAPDQQSDNRLIETGFAAKYAPSAESFGRILFVRNGGLWTVPFDHERLTIAGEAAEVAPTVGTFRDGAFFDTNGSMLVYRGGRPDYRLAWRNRRGDDLGQAGDAGQYTGVALSSDATRAAVARENRQNRSHQDIWIVDLQRNAMTRFTSDPLPKSIPTWLPDGRALLFAVGHDTAAIRLKSIDGGAERTVLHGPDLKGGAVNPLLTMMHVSADGEWLTFNLDTRGPARSDVWMLPLRDPQRAAPLIQQEFDQMHASMSPDKRWVAYVSNESGANQVFVRSLRFSSDREMPVTGSAIPVSAGGGSAPRWRADSGELFFHAADGAIMAATVTSTSIGEPSRLFDAVGALPYWEPTADGDRFLLALPASDHELPFTIVLNWMNSQQ